MITDVISQMSNEMVSAESQGKKADNNEVYDSKELTQGGESAKTDIVKKNEKSEEVRNSQTNGNYTAVSKDGDTLEISDNSEKNKITVSEKAQSNMSDTTLKNYSKAKLMQLLQSGKISRQQYNRILKKQKS